MKLEFELQSEAAAEESGCLVSQVGVRFRLIDSMGTEDTGHRDIANQRIDVEEQEGARISVCTPVKQPTKEALKRLCVFKWRHCVILITAQGHIVYCARVCASLLLLHLSWCHPSLF